MKSTKDIMNEVDDKLLLHYELNYVNNLKKQLQQYKQQIDELKQWLEDEINNSYSEYYPPQRKKVLTEVLSKLKEKDV